MELKIMSLDGKAAGSVDLPDAIFGLEPRADILHRCVRWQLAKRQRGTHDVKNRAEIHRTGKKMYRQKGTGSARHGSARVNLFRGGGRSFGPTPRSHAIDLPKKVRALALRHALSAKAKDGGIVLIEDARLAETKTRLLQGHFEKLGGAHAHGEKSGVAHYQSTSEEDCLAFARDLLSYLTSKNLSYPPVFA